MGKEQNKKKTDKQGQGFLPYVPKGALRLNCLGEMFSGSSSDDIISKIPLNPMATPELIASLKHETEPLDCVFEVDYRKGSKGDYADTAFESIANKILTSKTFVPSGYGHQSPQAVSYEGRDFYGTVIGMLLDKDNGKAYFRIIPDKGEHAEKIRRWLKNKQISAVSIWGFPTYDITGNTIIDYDLLSVDFVPPFTEGQKNEVYIGEMGGISHSELHDKLREGLRGKYKDYIYTNEFYDDFLIAEYETDLYKIPYSLQNGKVNLGAAIKVRRIVEYKSLEENMENVTNDELLSEIKSRVKDGRLSSLTVAGEMGLKVASEEERERLNALEAELDGYKKAAGEMGIAASIDFAKKAKEAEKKEAEKKAFGEMVEAVKSEKGLIKDGKPTGEMASMVDKFARLEQGMSREQIAGEMDRVINDADVQKMVQAKAAQNPIGEMGDKKDDNEKDIITF